MKTIINKNLIVYLAGILFVVSGCELFESPELNVNITALSTRSIKITWNDIPDAAAYRVEKMIVSSWSVMIQNHSTSYTEDGLNPNTTYQYRITAVFGGGGKNDISKTVSITTSAANVIPIYSEDYWGEWLAMPDTSMYGYGIYHNLLWKKTYITADQIYIGDEKISSALGSAGNRFTLSSLSDNVKIISFSYITANDKLYLFANRIKNGSLSGTIAGFNSSGSGSARNVAGGIGKISVVISNLANQCDTTTVTTDGNGNFIADNIIPEDIYQIDVDGQITTITPTTNDANIGTVTITDGVNFKTSLAPPDIKFDEDNFWFPTVLPETDIDFTRLYADGTNYRFYLYIENTGTKDATASTYNITLDDGLTLVSGNTTGILGTVEPGAKKTKYLPFTVNCPSVQNEYEYKTIRIQITDAINNKTWSDSVSLRFHKRSVSFNIAAQSNVQGVILSPAGNVYQFSGKDASVIVPWSSKDYLVVFTGASAAAETIYSLGIDTEPGKAFSGFIDVANYEPNNSETDAYVINRQERIMSYLHKGDFDYYRIKL